MVTPDGPVVLVTGAAGGIGYEIVRILLEELEGQVVANDVVEGRLGDLAAKHNGNLELVIGDISDEKTSIDAVKKAVGSFGRLTGVCLNAAVFGPCHRMDNSSPEAWAGALKINVLSYLYTLKHTLPQLRANKSRAIFTTSAAGQKAFVPGWTFYGMSKATVAFHVQQPALEEPAITVVGISPGMCDTGMVKGLMEGESYDGWSKEDAANYKQVIMR